MRNRLLMSAPLMTLLLVSSVLALSAGYSLRGDDGSINFIGSDSIVQTYNSHFNAYSTDGQGQGSLQLLGKSADGKRVVLNVGFKQVGAVETADNLTVQSIGTATYSKQGAGAPQRIAVNVVYTFDKNTNLTSVSGSSLSGFNFEVSGIETTNLI